MKSTSFFKEDHRGEQTYRATSSIHLLATLLSRQTHGVWMQEFTFDHQSDGCFQPCDEPLTLENGVLTIMLKCLGSWHVKSLALCVDDVLYRML